MYACVFILAENEATNNSIATLSGPHYASVNATVKFKLNSVLSVIDFYIMYYVIANMFLAHWNK